MHCYIFHMCTYTHTNTHICTLLFPQKRTTANINIKFKVDITSEGYRTEDTRELWLTLQ